MRREAGIKLRVLTYIVTLESDIDKPYIIVKSDYETQAWKAISDYFQNDFTDWDLIDFFEIPDDLQGKQCIVSNFRTDDFYVILWKDASGPFLDMTRDWDEFYRAHRSYRKKLKRLKRAFPECSIDTFESPEDVERGLEEFVALESLSWKKDKVGISRDKQHLEFYRELMPKLASLNTVVIKVLRNGSELIAGEVVYRFKDSLFFAHSTYNMKYAEYRPGTVFAGLVIKDFSGKDYAIGDNLCGYADYMNPWSSGIKETSRVNILRKSTLTAVLIIAWKTKRFFTRKDELILIRD
jgi:hypothetical protein